MITSVFSKCSIICLLTFDLYLAIDWLCFFPSTQKPSFWVISILSPVPCLSYPPGWMMRETFQTDFVSLGVRRSFWLFVSLLHPNIKYWLIEPGVVIIELLFSHVNKDIFALRCGKK